MFWILYTLNAIIFIYGTYHTNYNIIALSVAILLLIRLYQTKTSLLSKINNLPTTEQVIKEGKQKAKEYKNLTWYQKIIYLAAFKAGADYITKKLK